MNDHVHAWRQPTPAMLEDADFRGVCSTCSARLAPPRAGYEFIQLTACSACGASMVFWRTPAGKRSPHDLDGTSHFATCPAADRFRRTTPPSGRA